MPALLHHRCWKIVFIVMLILVSVSPQPVLAARIPSSSPAMDAAAPPPPAGCPAAITTTFASTAAVGIPTGPAVVTSTITVSGANPYLWDLDLQTYIQHTFAADLDITLQSPSGTVVTLTTDNGAGQDNVFNGTTWDDSGNNPVTDYVFTNLVLASPLSPEEPLGAFIGEDPNGDWVLTITDDAAADGGSLDSWSLALTAAPVLPNLSAATFSNATPVAIPTGPAIVTSTITVSGIDPYLWDLNLQTFIQHTFAADLDITLQSPAGTVVTLTTDNGSGNDDLFNGTIWDDSANDPATDYVYTNLVLASPLSPEEPQAAFIGQDPNGDWVLTISDDLAGDGGSLNNWSLIFETSSGCPDALTVINTNPAANAKPASLKTMQVTFSEAVVSDGSARAANNTANYLLVRQGANGAFDTITCSSGLSGDDVAQSLASAAYDAASLTATLNIDGKLAIGNYRLFVCGTTSIWSATGVELNYGASDTTVDFAIQPRAAAGDPAALPPTGFAPGSVTVLAAHPVEKAYTQSDLVLDIPKLGVKTEVVGVPQSDGSWDVSWLGNQAGWLEGSAYPTWQGNSVITGHVWNADNTPGLFVDLKTLAYGDHILVHAFRQTFTYEVRENKRIDSASVQSVLKHEELTWLTLLTCEEYQVLWNTYSARRVVRAVLVNVE